MPMYIYSQYIDSLCIKNQQRRIKMAGNNELMRGSVEVVILKLLSEHDMYGYEMIKTVNENGYEFGYLVGGTFYTDVIMAK